MKFWRRSLYSLGVAFWAALRPSCTHGWTG